MPPAEEVTIESAPTVSGVMVANDESWVEVVEFPSDDDEDVLVGDVESVFEESVVADVDAEVVSDDDELFGLELFVDDVSDVPSEDDEPEPLLLFDEKVAVAFDDDPGKLE
jgi:hypothetical protein